MEPHLSNPFDAPDFDKGCVSNIEPLGEPFPSQYGVVSYLEWCRHEEERSKTDGTRWFTVVGIGSDGRKQCCLHRVAPENRGAA